MTSMCDDSNIKERYDLLCYEKKSTTCKAVFLHVPVVTYQLNVSLVEICLMIRLMIERCMISDELLKSRQEDRLFNMNTQEIERFINTCNMDCILKCDHVLHDRFRVPYFNMQSSLQVESNDHLGIVQLELDMVLHFLKNQMAQFEKRTNFDEVSTDWSNLSNWHQIGKVYFVDKEYNLFEKAKNCCEFFLKDCENKDVQDIDETETYQLLGTKTHIPCDSLGCDKSVTRMPMYRQELLKINVCSECSNYKRHLREMMENEEENQEVVPEKCAKMK